MPISPDPVLAQLHLDLNADLLRIAKRFKSPRITLIVRNPALNDGDVVLTDDDPEKAIAALRRFIGHQHCRCGAEGSHPLTVGCSS